MGTVVATYSERQQRFFRLGQKLELKPEGVRKALASPLRYCLGANFLYLPADHPDIDELGQLCWARLSTDTEIAFEVDFRSEQPGKSTRQFTLEQIEAAGARIGDRYRKRQRETKQGFVEVPEFCAQTLIESLAKNPEALPHVSHSEFESLCAELFVRRGFQVDLFRPTHDGGIDFLSVKDDGSDPIIFAVQCKQPEIRDGKRRKAVGRPVLQQIYGAAKAWDLKGGIVVSGSTYSTDAKNFSNNKPEEMKLYDSLDLIQWITKFRWNEDEEI